MDHTALCPYLNIYGLFNKEETIYLLTRLIITFVHQSAGSSTVILKSPNKDRITGMG